MLQAIQIMLMTLLITVVVGFLVSFMIQILSRVVNLGGGRKSETDDAELALALAVALDAAREAESTRSQS